MARPSWKRTIKPALKLIIGALVLWAVGRHIFKTLGELSKHTDAFRIDPSWTLLSVLIYMVGLLILGVVYGKVMQASPTPVGMRAAIRAYVISHLGKYVPGKAVVVILRVGLVVPYQANAATAAFATFYETFAMMASGAIIAALGFAAGFDPNSGLGSPRSLALLVSVGLALCFLLVSDPHVFPRISKLATLPFPNVGPAALPRFSYRLLGTALLWSALGWIMLGLSQVALIRAISTEGPSLGLWPYVTACVALATVGGFAVAVLPAGLGVREGILMTLLEPILGEERAVIAALALRLVWVAGEILAGGIFWGLRPSPPPALSSPLLLDAEVS